MTIEDRIVELQSRMSFQEDAIEALTKTVSEQQGELSRLYIQLKHLHDKLKHVEANTGLDSDDNVPPPHY